MKYKFKLRAWDKYFLIFFSLIALLFYMEDFHFFVKSYKSYHGINSFSLTKAQDTKKYTVLLVYPSNSLSETQQFSYNCIAAERLGWNCYTFGFNERIVDDQFMRHYISFVQKAIQLFIDPDFVIYISPHMMTNKLDNVVTFGILDLMQKDVFQFRVNDNLNPDSLKWMEHIDGFLIYGENKWYKSLFEELRKYYKISNFIKAGFYPSVFKTNFKDVPREKLFYCGYNWDIKRGSKHYREIYQLLDTKGYFEAYGMKRVWGFLNYSYKGLISIDPVEFIRTMEEKGITLVLHSAYHLEYGLPSNRIFEAAASNNVAISDYHPFIQQEFGECVFNINFDESPEKVVSNIDRIVKLLKLDKGLANNKAKCLHDRFNNKFSLESQLLKIGEMYEEIVKHQKLEIY